MPSSLTPSHAQRAAPSSAGVHAPALPCLPKGTFVPSEVPTRSGAQVSLHATLHDLQPVWEPGTGMCPTPGQACTALNSEASRCPSLPQTSRHACRCPMPHKALWPTAGCHDSGPPSACTKEELRLLQKGRADIPIPILQKGRSGIGIPHRTEGKTKIWGH